MENKTLNAIRSDLADLEKCMADLKKASDKLEAIANSPEQKAADCAYAKKRILWSAVAILNIASAIVADME